MDLDLTPKKYRKSNTPRKRHKTPRVLKNWRNPFQMAILVLAVVAFVGSSVYERVKEYRIYNAQFGPAESAAAKIAELDAQATELFKQLQVLREGAILKAKSDQETSLERRLTELNHQLDNRFQRVNASFSAMPRRYQKKFAVRKWFIDFTRQLLESALARQDYEQARLWFNASAVNVLLPETRIQVEGMGSLEITAGSNIEQVVVIPVKSDGPCLVLCDPVKQGNEFPLEISDLEPGSYLVWATRTDGIFAPYPVYIEHGESKPLDLEAPSSLPKGMIFIPGGTFYCGGAESTIYRYHQSTLPAFFIKQKEVTVGEYLEFWKGLQDPVQKDACISRISFQAGDDMRAAWDSNGQLLDERLSLDYPVVGITHHAAVAYCNWLSNKLGKVVRLPTADEWEKAARGVDGRTYPWGYGFEPDANLALTLDNPKGKAKYPLWAPPGRFKLDASIYGVFDMGGNVREMTSTPMPGREDVFQIKGGSASTPADYLACDYVSDTPAVPSDVGFRYLFEASGE